MNQRLPPVNDVQAEPLALAAALRSSVAACPISHLYPILGWQNMPQRASGIGILRITMVLSGLRHIELPAQDGIYMRALAAGEMIVVAPSGWSKPISKAPHRVINIECFPNFTRFVLQSHGGEPAHPDDGTFHSATPMAAEIRALQQALILMLDTQDTERIFPITQCFMQEILRECKPWEHISSGLADWQRAVLLMHNRDDMELRRDVVAAEIGVHENHVSRLCKKYTGKSFADFVTGLRMNRACTYLRNRHLSVAEVSHLAGYHDETHFRKRFKQIYGKTPSLWRKQLA